MVVGSSYYACTRGVLRSSGHHFAIWWARQEVFTSHPTTRLARCSNEFVIFWNSLSCAASANILPPHPAHTASPQNLKNLLLLLIRIGTGSDFPQCALLIPSLRNDRAVLNKLIVLCYNWAEHDSRPLVSLTILAGFSTASNWADLPAARHCCMLIRRFPNFHILMRISIEQARHSLAHKIPPTHQPQAHTSCATLYAGTQQERRASNRPILGRRPWLPAAERD